MRIKSATSIERETLMVEMFLSGKTQQEIGLAFSVSRQYVQQCIFAPVRIVVIPGASF